LDTGLRPHTAEQLAVAADSDGAGFPPHTPDIRHKYVEVLPCNPGDTGVNSSVLLQTSNAAISTRRIPSPRGQHTTVCISNSYQPASLLSKAYLTDVLQLLRPFGAITVALRHIGTKRSQKLEDVSEVSL